MPAADGFCDFRAAVSTARWLAAPERLEVDYCSVKREMTGGRVPPPGSAAATEVTVGGAWRRASTYVDAANRPRRRTTSRQAKVEYFSTRAGAA